MFSTLFEDALEAEEEAKTIKHFLKHPVIFLLTVGMQPYSASQVPLSMGVWDEHVYKKG